MNAAAILSTELSKRVATAVVGVAALLALLIWGGGIGMYAITLILALGMMVEYAQLSLALHDGLEKKYLLLFLTWAVVTLDFALGGAELGLALFLFIALFTYFLFTADRHAATPADLLAHFRELATSVFGMFYLVLALLLLARLREAAHGVLWVIDFLLIVWAGDTGGYFGGKKFGRKKLYPAISPKKTREGALCGLAAGIIVTAIFKLALFHDLPWAMIIVGSPIVGVTAQVGDLCESFLKRAFDKKDSGTILPGHGGFLDRFDGVVFSLPVMYACLKLFSS